MIAFQIIMNNNHNLVKYANGTLKKIYSSKERFDCELKYIQLFKDHGFYTPKVISKDEGKLEIVFNNIQGHVSLLLANEELTVCIEQLARVYVQWPFEDDTRKISEYYAGNIRLRLQEFSQEHELVLNQERLGGYLRTLRERFDVSLFKDAKPSNWIFDGNGVCLIDFDYVKPSFYLADIAQLLNYQQLSNEEKYGYVDRFMKLIGKEESHVYLLFDLASINSRIMAMRYNVNLNEYYLNKFTQSLKEELGRMKLV